ncbi:MAG: ATP-binding protein [Deltaproteobacteria bacterium]|nr:ATP-binding protein [Deltaproteobacteria bacterium]
MGILPYSPSHLSTDTLEAITVGESRKRLLATIEQAVLAEKNRPRHQHQLLVGPRGSGKTHLLTQLARRIESRGGTEAGFTPVVLAEEEVARTPADLLLRMLQRIAEGRASTAAAPAAAVAARELPRVRAERDASVALESAIEALRAVAESLGTKLLVVAENLDALLFAGPGLARKTALAEQWALRKALQESRHILLLAAAPTQFGEVREEAAPFHDFFRVHELEELSPEEMIELVRRRLEWELAAASGAPERRARLLALRAGFDGRVPTMRGLLTYTGGLPRFAHLLYDVIAETDVTGVRSILEGFLDAQTPYFQSWFSPRILPEAELEVLDMLASAEGPLGPSDLSATLRAVPPNQVATLLQRLMERRLVRRRGAGSAVRYDVAEPLVRVWRRFRLGRSEQEQLLLYAEFIAAVFAPRDLWSDLLCMRQRLDKTVEPGERSCIVSRIELVQVALTVQQRTLAKEAAPPDGAAGPADASFAKAEAEYLSGNLHEALRLFEDALQGARKAGSDHLARHLVRLSYVALGAGNLPRAVQALDEAEGLLQPGDHVGRGSARRARAGLLAYLGRHEEALAAYDLAEKECRLAADDFERAKCLVGRGEVLLHMDRHDDALTALDHADELFQATGDDLGRANCLGSRGRILHLLRKFDHALAAFDEAERVFEKLGDGLGRGNCLYGRGITLFHRDRDDEALGAFDRAAALYKDAGHDLGRANCLIGRSEVLMSREQPEEALAALDEADRLFRDLGEDLGRGNCLLGRGRLLSQMGKMTEALAAFEQAEKLYEKAADQIGRGHCARGRCEALITRGAFREAAAECVAALAAYHAQNSLADLAIGAQLAIGLLACCDKDRPEELPAVIRSLGEAREALGSSDAYRSGLVNFVTELLARRGPADMLALLPGLEGTLDDEHRTFLSPARMAAQVMSGERPKDLPDAPEELRRTVDQLLEVVASRKKGAETASPAPT